MPLTIDPGLGKLFESIFKVGGKVIDKLWMDKYQQAQITITKDQMKNDFDLAIKKMVQDGEFKEIEAEFREHQAQRQFANDQFGTLDALSRMGWVGKVIALGRASIRWAITGGSMFFTWKIVNTVLTDAAVAALFAGTLGTAAATILGLLITLVVGIPVFYVSGISVEKIMKVRSQL